MARTKQTRRWPNPTPPPPPPKPMKKRKDTWKTLREIRNAQRSSTSGDHFTTIIPKSTFMRIVREIVNKEANLRRLPTSYRMEKAALAALHEALEIYIHLLYTDAYLCTIHGKRITMNPNDMKLASLLKEGANWRIVNPPIPRTTMKKRKGKRKGKGQEQEQEKEKEKEVKEIQNEREDFDEWKDLVE